MGNPFLVGVGLLREAFALIHAYYLKPFLYIALNMISKTVFYLFLF